MKKKIHNPLAKKPTNKNNQKGFRFFLARIVTYCNTEKKRFLLLMLVLFLGIGIGGISVHQNMVEKPVIATEEARYWLLLHRRANIEFLYYGTAGSEEKSHLVKVFKVKTGIPRERPTPLPQLLGKQYWVITEKTQTKDNPETSPYFLTLNIPVSKEEPYGPVPYKECVDSLTGETIQCNWILPGAFGLHGINGDMTRLDSTDDGSSGCIRHTDEDITYLYTLLEPKKEKIRYYIEDK